MTERISSQKYQETLIQLSALHKNYTSNKYNPTAIKAIEEHGQRFLDTINKYYTFENDGLRGVYHKWQDKDKVSALTKNILGDLSNIKMEKERLISKTIQMIYVNSTSKDFVRSSHLIISLFGLENKPYRDLINEIEDILSDSKAVSLSRLTDLDSNFKSALNELDIKKENIKACLGMYNAALRTKLQQKLTQSIKNEAVEEFSQLPRETVAEKAKFLTELKRWESKNVALFQDTKEDIKIFKAELLKQLSPIEDDPEKDLLDSLQNSIDEIKILFSKLSPEEKDKVIKGDAANRQDEKTWTHLDTKKLEIQKGILDRNLKDTTGILAKMCQFKADVIQAVEFYSRDLNISFPWESTESESVEAMVAEGMINESDLPLIRAAIQARQEDQTKKYKEALETEPFLKSLMLKYEKGIDLERPFVPKFSPVDQFRKLLEKAEELGAITSKKADKLFQSCQTENGFKMNPQVVKELWDRIEKQRQ